MSITIKQKQRAKQEDLLRVLTKGMVTIPKKWRDELNIETGDRVRAYRQGNQIIIEPMEEAAPYRIYTQKEIDEFVKEDSLPSPSGRKVKKTLFNG